jgi:hypothetical protein
MNNMVSNISLNLVVFRLSFISILMTKVNLKIYF